MNSKRPICLVLVIAAAALGVVGCGGGDDEPSAQKAQEKYQKLNTELHAFSEELGATIRGASGKTDDQLRSELEALANKVGEQVDGVQDLEVPDDVTNAKAHLVAALKVGVGDIREIASAAGRHDTQAAVTAVRQLATDSKDIAQAQTELKTALEKAVKN